VAFPKIKPKKIVFDEEYFKQYRGQKTNQKWELFSNDPEEDIEISVSDELARSDRKTKKIIDLRTKDAGDNRFHIKESL